GLVACAEKQSDPAAGIESDKAADESGRFAPSGLVAGSEEKRPCRWERQVRENLTFGFYLLCLT
ncbi:MAG: hypothetical protein COV79_01595, partial [Parcubacteria group bacterium CG11_big_fil_rev_8_21_14_0_20_41_14]